ncbi:Hypothetical_protein [Hexamita inflata]|uniref:Hypothetical_protein n=1 Tax=Hexamita inflata TaxID=28002 RepID=A0AA86NJP4_9EUKA|nr:Hypothetical protein HINF_LOCUS7898 [Hexamita inflata]
MNNLHINNNVILSQQSGNIFILNDKVQETNIILQVNDMTYFAIFGLNNNQQQIYDSQISVVIQFSVVYGSLICQKCDVFLLNSSLVFEARGQYLSAIIQQALTKIIIITTIVQYRFYSQQYSSGVILMVKNNTLFVINDTNITGYEYITNEQSSVLIALSQIQVSVQILSLQLCSNVQNLVDNQTNIQFSEEPKIECKSICGQNLQVVYGFCQLQLLYGTMQLNDTLMCVQPFVFNDDSCFCIEGNLLDGNDCINVLDQLKYLNLSDYELEQHLINNFSAIQIQRNVDLQLLDDNLKRNTTNILTLISQFNSQLRTEIQNINTSFASLANLTQVQFTQLKDEIQKVNNSAFTQIQQTSNQLQSALISLNSSTKQQFDVQNQLFLTTNQTLFNMNGQLSATVSQMNTNLQKQIDGTKNDVKIVQSQITGINAIINNINSVNAVQSQDIQALKNQQSSNMNGAFWCMMNAQTQTSQNQFSGYCSALKLCCASYSYNTQYKQCYIGNDSTYWYTNSKCGTFQI